LIDCAKKDRSFFPTVSEAAPPPNTVLGGKGASLGEGPFLRVKYKKK
jgi:hypothetical protein